MDNFNNSNILDDDNWQSFQAPIVKSDETTEAPQVEIKPKKQSKHPILTIQLIISLCALLFLFVIKFLGAPIYNTIMSWYESEISKSVIYNGNFESFDFSTLFSTADES